MRPSSLTLWPFLFTVLNALEVPTISSEQQYGFVGNYAGVSHVESEHQFESLSHSSWSLITQQSKYGSFQQAGLFNGGNVTCSCSFDNGDLFLGGYFISVNQQLVNRIVKYNVKNRQFETIKEGLNGPVYTMYCDKVQQCVYIGGNFSLPNNTNSTFGNVIQWNLSNKSWTSLPWMGFDGPVYTIKKNKKQNTLLFGGQFESTGDGQFFNLNTSHIVSMNPSSAAISSGNGGFNSNASSIVCPAKTSPTSNSSQNWYLQEGVPGYWDANFNDPITPTVFRLSNTGTDRGTVSFYVLALGSNEVYELSYLDPTTQQTMFCSSDCILSNSTYQDFSVVNSIVTSGIRIYINTWYGSGGGLGFVQIFQSDIFVNPSLENDPQCTNTSASSYYTKTTVTGDWKPIYVYGYYRNVLEAIVPYSNISTSNVSITYEPHIPAQGLYEIYATTPGCVGSSNCNQRTQIVYQFELLPNIITTVTKSQAVFSDTRSLIYKGAIAPASNGFRPSIQLRIAPNATTSSEAGNVAIMADTIEFIRNSSAFPLHGILEYNLTAANNTTSWRPLAQQLPVGSTVYSIDTAEGDIIYIGGNFSSVNSSIGYQGIVSYNYSSGELDLLDAQGPSGLNGKVLDVLFYNSDLFVGGEFSSILSSPSIVTRNVIKFDTVKREWTNLELGVDGAVHRLFMASDNKTLTLSGHFQTYQTQTNQKISIGNAHWNLETHTWIEPESLIVGEIVKDTLMAEQERILVGNIRGAQTFRTDLVTSTDLYNSRTIFPENVMTTSSIVWNRNDSSPITIVAYQNYSQSRQEQAQTTFIAYKMNDTQTIFSEVNGTINSLVIVEDILYAAGQFTASSQNNISSSLVVYDLNHDMMPLQTAGVADNDNQPGIIHKIKVHPDGKHMLIGGRFSQVGTVGCESICMMDLSTRQWSAVNPKISGTVWDIIDTNEGDDSVMAVGDLMIEPSSKGSIVQIRRQDDVWSALLYEVHLPPGVATSALSIANDQLIVSGISEDTINRYVVLTNRTGFTSLGHNLISTSQVYDISLVDISNASSQRRFPENTQSMLLAIGHLQLANFGYVSAALFDGSEWYPYLLTTQINGDPGVLYQIIQSTTTKPTTSNNNPHHYLPVAAVVLISTGISAGIIFTSIGLGLIYLYQTHKTIL